MVEGAGDLLAEVVAELRTKFWGIYRGVVTDTVDPLGLERVRLIVPAVTGPEQTGWAPACVPVGGVADGMAALPPVGAGVWVQFEVGDPGYPVWVGVMRTP